MKTKRIYYADWVAARNASCRYHTGWERLGMQEGFCMVNRVCKQVELLIVGRDISQSDV